MSDPAPNFAETHKVPPNFVFPNFAEKAKHLVAHHPPQTVETGDCLDEIRLAFDDVIERIGYCIPEGPDATRAAYAIRDACQACIAAVVLNQVP